MSKVEVSEPKNKTEMKEPDYILELREVFHQLNHYAEKLSSFDLWDNETMEKINKAEAHVRNAMTEIIEITGVETQTQEQ